LGTRSGEGRLLGGKERGIQNGIPRKFTANDDAEARQLQGEPLGQLLGRASTSGKKKERL